MVLIIFQSADKNVKKQKIVFIIFFIITLVLSCLSKYKDGGDDLFFKTAASNNSLFPFIISRYLNWSGRIIPDALAYLFNSKLEVIWPLFNSIIITLLSVLIFNYINLLTTLKNNKRFLLVITVCLSFLLINKTIIEPAFLWKTGSINYLWPTTMGLFILYPFLLSIKNKLTKKNNYFYFFVSLLAVISSEQISVAMILGITTYFIYMFLNKKKIPLILYLITFNLFLGSIILFLAPGNQLRLQAETKHNFPDFLSLSVFNRISISLYWMLNKLINVCSLSLAFIYLIVGFKNSYTKNITLKVFSTIAIFLGILLIVKNIFSINFNILPITSNNYLSFNILIKYIISLVGLSLIPYLIWKLFGNLKNSFIYFLILFIALITMLMITFSPTIDASGSRVLFLPIILINILAILTLFKE